MARLLAYLLKTVIRPRLLGPMPPATTAGSVDDGKCVQIGRLPHHANSISDEQLEASSRGHPNRSSVRSDFSLLAGGLKAEREPGITRGVAYRHCAGTRRRLLIADNWPSTFETARTFVLDQNAENGQTGSFVRIDPVDNVTLAAGMAERSAIPVPVARRSSVSPVAVTATERRQRSGHGPAVVISSSSVVLFALQRALFERGSTTVVLQILPPPALLRDLLANGLIVLAPPGSHVELDGVAWLEAAAVGSRKQSVSAVLWELERRGVLSSRDWVSPGEGI